MTYKDLKTSLLWKMYNVCPSCNTPLEIKITKNILGTVEVCLGVVEDYHTSVRFNLEKNVLEDFTDLDVQYYFDVATKRLGSLCKQSGVIRYD